MATARPIASKKLTHENLNTTNQNTARLSYV
jgi:hypothetical protein